MASDAVGHRAMICVVGTGVGGPGVGVGVGAGVGAGVGVGVGADVGGDVGNSRCANTAATCDWESATSHNRMSVMCPSHHELSLTSVPKRKPLFVVVARA